MKSICSWDPNKHEGRPCPHHHLSMQGGKYFVNKQEISKEDYESLRATHADEPFDAWEPKTLESLPKLEKELTPIEAMESTNPKLQEYNTKDYGRQNNCQKCCAAFELRMRGYDVTAAPWNPVYEIHDGKLDGINADKPGLKEAFGISWRNRFDFCDFAYSYYAGGKATEYDRAKAATEYEENVGKHEHFKIGNQDSYRLLGKGPKKVIQENISKFPNSRWVISVDWADTIGYKRKYKNGGHVFMAVVDDKGKIKFLDPQTGEEATNESHWSKLAYQQYSDTECYRIDNHDFNEDALESFIYDKEKTDDDY